MDGRGALIRSSVGLDDEAPRLEASHFGRAQQVAVTNWLIAKCEAMAQPRFIERQTMMVGERGQRRHAAIGSQDADPARSRCRSDPFGG